MGTHECYVPGRVIEVDCGEDDMGDGNFGLRDDGEDGYGCAIWIVVGLVVEYYSGC